MSKFVRLRLEFPHRQTCIDATSYEVWTPLTFVGYGSNWSQKVEFTEVEDELAAKLATVNYRPAFPRSDDNPPRFDVVDDAETARAIEERDRKRIVVAAQGRSHAKLGKLAA